MRQLWVRVAVIAALALLAVPAAMLLDPFVADRVAEAVGADALGHLLDILAGTMLTVTTFSLSVMVSVNWSASGQLTPRAHRELLTDTTTQNVLATFTGAWIYSLAAIVIISTPLFGPKELVALFAITILVLVLIVAAVLRWILHLQTLGTLLDTTQEMEASCVAAIRQRLDLSVPPIPPGGVPEGCLAVRSGTTGFVQGLYEDALQEIAARGGVTIHVVAHPGRFVTEGQALAWIEGQGDADIAGRVSREIVLGDVRTPDQDPRFGLIQLSELASKALSPAVNDPGTAIDVLGRIARCLLAWEAATPDVRRRHDRLRMLPLDPGEVASDAFDAIARDGRNQVEVAVAVQKRIAAVIEAGDSELRPGLLAVAARARERALASLDHPHDRARLEAAVSEGVRE